MTPWSKLTFAALCLSPPSSADAGPARHRYQQPCMGTLFRVVVVSGAPANEVAEAVGAAFKIAHEIDAALSDYRADSEVSRFNRSTPGEPQAMGTTFAEVLRLSAQMADDTGGAFDPARGALSWLWRSARRTGALPEPATLTAALEASGISKIAVDEEASTATRLAGGTRLDFGGIAKGYAADQMLASLRERGFPCASVAAGGDVAVGDAPPGKRGWRVEIRPYGAAGAPAAAVEIANAAVSTSGDFEQAITIGGVRFSHVIDPATGLGMKTRRAATVIAATAAESDALATALCVLGQGGLPMIKGRADCEAAIFLPKERPEDNPYFSPGFEKLTR